ncbi:ATP-binding cassette domain-containing protein [Carboxylicivirga taeanensis]|uniref:ATP-binding cassette domain-containing protein n=1 Tax=Carboxylicivirga taeanensis TaxID=1416875 RepID=UPI003F6E0162
MSEEILKALIQLFALIAFPRTEIKSRRTIVKSFLNQQLNSRLVEEYLQLFDTLQEEHEQRLSNKEKFNKRYAASSVKVLKIATGINDALTYYQKLIVLIQLIEFLNIDVGMSDYEREFIETVAQTFNIPQDEYLSIIKFVTSPFNELPDDANLLIVDNYPKQERTPFRHLFWDGLKGELRVIHLKSVNLFAFRFSGNMDLTMNGQLISEGRVQILNPGSSLRNKLIDTIFYSDIFSQFMTDNKDHEVDFRCVDVEYHFSKKAIGLHRTSFAAKSGKMVGIMGSSGAGKSTLVNVLSGINAPTKGQVFINDVDVHKNLDKAKGLIGYVAQDDLLMEDLTVYENLYYNAKLCFDNLTEQAVQRKVLKLLRSLGLYEIRFMKVGSPLNKKISGGQRKRLNIALELIREPSILFLDEPTSGLSSRDSDNIIDLLKELSIRGKLVFVVIHQPSSAIFKMFNQLLVLDTGGYLIYNGDPVESVNYFKACINHANRDESECPSCGNVNVEQILNIINSQILDEYGNFTQTRRVDPKEWYDLFHEGWESHEPPAANKSTLPPISFQIPRRLKQLFIFMKRDIASKLANKQYLLINLLETPVLALLLASIIRYYDVDNATESVYSFSKNPNITVYIIISVIIALFVGLTVSAEEIINDRKIKRRESFLKLSRLSYLLSKLLILGGISAIQSALFVLVGNSIIALKGMFLPYWLILFSSSVFANLLGLNISDTFKKTVNIYIIIPFLIIPQLILSGVFISFDRLNPNLSSPARIPAYGEIITARWAFEALAVTQYTDNKFDSQFYSYEKLKSQAKYRKEFWIPALENHLQKVIALQSEHVQESTQTLSYSVNLINKELKKHHRLYPERAVGLTLLNHTIHKTNLDSVKTYITYLTEYYKALYNEADNRLDHKTKQHTSSQADRISYLNAKSTYHNDALERFVTNSNNFFSNKIIEYDGELWQKLDPIFQDPEGRFIKAHFLSPTKPIGTSRIDTYAANMGVIWLINLILFITLYTRALPGLLSLRTRLIWYFRDRKKAE